MTLRSRQIQRFQNRQTLDIMFLSALLSLHVRRVLEHFMRRRSSQERMNQVNMLIALKSQLRDSLGPRSAECAGERKGVGEVDGEVMQEPQVFKVVH